MGFRRFERYLEKVFGFGQAVLRIRDGRLFPLICLPAMVRAVFWSAVLRMASVHEVERECRRGKLQAVVGAMSEDVIGYVLERVDLSSIEGMWIGVAKRLKRNGVLVCELAGGRLIAAVDGIELFSSFSCCCERCLKRRVTLREAGVEVSRLQYDHRIVVVSLVGLAFRVPLGLEFLRQGEDEVATAERLLGRLRKRLGCWFFDVLTLDALDLRADFVSRVEAMGWDWVLTRKENQAELLDEVRHLTCNRPAHEQGQFSEQRRYALWQTQEASWDTARRTVRAIRCIEERTARMRVGKDKHQQIKQRENVWVTSLSAGCVGAKSVHRVGKVRWELETRLFGDLTLHWSLKHAALHKPVALEAWLQIRLIAYLLFRVFLYRQVYSRLGGRYPSFIECARWLYNSLGLSALPHLDSS